MMFLVGVVCSICMTILNFVVFIISRGGSQVDILIVIIIGSIVGALVALPLLGFLIFHLYLFLSGKTTRELLKHVVREDTDNNNQWCNVDPPLIDYYAQISPL